MKKIYILLWVVFVFQFACTKNFETINTNPNASATPVKEYLFSNALLNTLNNNYFLIQQLNCGGFIQHYATYKEVSGVGDKYYINDFYQAPFFTDAYPLSVNLITEVINASAAIDDINKKSIARIWKVYTMHRITDLYGDVPYSEAAKGATGLIFSPKYDAQETIYTQFFQELDQSINSLDASKSNFGKADLIYNGDIIKWKKFAASLMLRLAMRLTKVNNDLAKSWALKAINYGVILNQADIAYMTYTDGPQNYNRNPISFETRTRDFVANSFGKTNIEGGKLSKTFIDFLKLKKDPRLNVISCVWNNKVIDTNTNIQRGFPNGVGTVPSGDSLGTFSEPNQNTVLKMDAPLIIISNAEIQLLLAEVALRGWTTEDPTVLYSKAITSSLQNFQLFGAVATIGSTKITNFVNNNTLTNGTFEEKMKQIHTEFWVALYLDEIECYSNFRRTGYPILVPVNYPGNSSSGQIPRRLIYPSIESAANSVNYLNAVSKQGANNFLTRVWWDK